VFSFRLPKTFRGSSPKSNHPTLTRKTRVAPNLGVEYVLFEHDKPAYISGYVDLSDMWAGDRVEISVYVALDHEFRLLRSVVLEGKQGEPLLYLEERFYPKVKVVLTQRSGIEGRTFVSYWYKR